MIAGLFATAGAVGAFVALGAAMGRGEVDRPYSVRPVPPRPARTADPDVWVDPCPHLKPGIAPGAVLDERATA
jgi:hypothetical protein